MIHSGARLVTIGQGLALALLLIPATAIGAQDDPAMPPLVEALKSCQAIAEDTARLACFDRETNALFAATAKGEVKIVDQEQAKAMRRSLFGFQLPRIGIFAGKDNAEEQAVDQLLTSTITRVRPLADGKYRITIAEGDAVWETNESRMSMRTPKVGDSVEFEKASLGSYWIRINGQKGVKGKRVN